MGGKYEAQGVLVRTIISPASAATGSRAYRRHRTDRQYPHPASHTRHHRLMKDPGIRSSSSSSSSPSSSMLREWGAAAAACARGASPSRASSVSALALLRVSENDIGEDDDADVVVFGVPFATSPTSLPHSARSSGDGGERYCCCLLESGSGVAHDNGDPLRLLISSSSSEPKLSASWSFLLLFAPLPFAKRDMARAAPIALRQHARGSKFSHRPQRSCSTGAAKLVSHACDNACSAASRRAGLGWRRARMKFFAVMEGAKVG